MSNPTSYPVNPAPRTLDSVVALASDKLATWKRAGLTVSAIADEHAILLDANGRACKANALASTATYAVWVNVTTRYGGESKLAEAIRKASGKRGEVKLPGGEDARAKMVLAIAEAVTPFLPRVKADRKPAVKADANDDITAFREASDTLKYGGNRIKGTREAKDAIATRVDNIVVALESEGASDIRG